MRKEFFSWLAGEVIEVIVVLLFFYGAFEFISFLFSIPKRL